MGKHVFISDDETIGSDDRFLIFTSSVFNVIFDLAGVFFKPWESACKNLCYEETGVDGIDLTNSIREISHDSFNIFYLRCREGLAHYPDDGMLTWLVRGTHLPGRASISIMQPIAAKLTGTALRKLQVLYC